MTESGHRDGPVQDDGPDLSAWTLGRRLAWVGAFRRLVVRREAELCRLIGEEIGKPRFEAFTADVTTLLAACRWAERHAPSLLRDRRVRGTPVWMWGTKVIQQRAPLGRVAIIATWNYPVQLLGIQLLHAIIGGNTVVVKPSERSPKTQLFLLGLAVEAGLPRGLLTWTSASREAGAELIRDSKFDHVVFTGSTGVGRVIARELATTLTPATLELAGHDSAIVLEDADPQLAAQTVWAAASMNAGQTCMAPRRVLVENAVYSRFVEQIERLAGERMSRSLIDPAAGDLCRALVDSAVKSGGRVAGGDLGPAGGASIPCPIAVIDCPAECDLMKGAHFGPLLAVRAVGSADDALRLHRQTGQHLATMLFTRDLARAKVMAAALASSIVMVNDAIMPIGHPGVVLGGRGPSGMGISRGPDGLLAMTRPVSLTISKATARRALHPPDARLEARISDFIRWWYGR